MSGGEEPEQSRAHVGPAGQDVLAGGVDDLGADERQRADRPDCDDLAVGDRDVADVGLQRRVRSTNVSDCMAPQLFKADFDALWLRCWQCGHNENRLTSFSPVPSTMVPLVRSRSQLMAWEAEGLRAPVNAVVERARQI
jgi:hypothetical protein